MKPTRIMRFDKSWYGVSYFAKFAMCKYAVPITQRQFEYWKSEGVKVVEL